MTINGWTLADDGRWWIGPDGTRLRAISGGGSSGKTTTTVVNQIPPKTDEEITLLRKQNELFDIQIGELKRQNEALESVFPEQKALLRAQTQFAIEAAEFQREQIPFARQAAAREERVAGVQEERARRSAELQEELVTRALADLEGTPEEREIKRLSDQRALAILRGEAPPLLPGQQERIEKVFGRAAEEAQAGLRSFGEDLATSRGMRVTDTPIGGELLRQGRELASSLAAAKAGTELNVGQSEQQFGEAVRQFQENLRQRAFENRLVLTGQGVGGVRGGGALPIGQGMTPVFATTTPQATLAGIQGSLNLLGQERMAGATQRTTSRTEQFPGVLDYVRAAASVAGAVAASSARLKKAIVPLDVDEYEKARRTVAALPVARFRYTWEDDARLPHIGVIAELSPPEIREGSLKINLMDLAGLTVAAVKGIDRRVDRIEARLPVAA